MRGCANNNASIGLCESLMHNLRLKYSNINNIIEKNKNRPHRTKRKYVNVKFNQMMRNYILKLPCEFFFEQDNEGDTLLHISIIMKRFAASLWLINKATTHPNYLNITNYDGHTALHLAVLTHESRVVRKLVLAGANTELKTLFGNTPLHLACALSDLACVKAITEPVSILEQIWLAKSIQSRSSPKLPQNLELRNHDGKTCLHIAASKGHLGIVEQLVRAGADIHAQENLGGRTALYFAIYSKYEQVVSYLLQHRRSCLDDVTYAGVTVYQMAVDVHHKIAEDLLK